MFYDGLPIKNGWCMMMLLKMDDTQMNMANLHDLSSGNLT